MKAVREAFEAARLDGDRIDDAIVATETVLAADTDHATAMAYLGALHAMKAGASPLPWIKMRHVNLASTLLDEAHARRFDARAEDAPDYPTELEVLLLRGIAYANFPPFLGRVEAARDCLETARDHPAFLTVPKLYRALAYAHLAVLFDRGREAVQARGCLEHALEADAAAADDVWTAR